MLDNIQQFTDMSHIRELSPEVIGPSSDSEYSRELDNVGQTLTSYWDREKDQWYFGKDNRWYILNYLNTIEQCKNIKKS